VLDLSGGEVRTQLVIAAFDVRGEFTVHTLIAPSFFTLLFTHVPFDTINVPYELASRVSTGNRAKARARAFAGFGASDDARTPQAQRAARKCP
jgi:uncharacterized membrane protein YozB (DUF420 family)